jgi:hypothetical protein
MDMLASVYSARLQWYDTVSIMSHLRGEASKLSIHHWREDQEKLMDNITKEPILGGLQ